MLPQFLANNSSIQIALPVLIDAALKGAILVAIAALAAYVLRKRSAASRHAVWTAAVIGHLAIPVLMLILPAWRIPLLPAAPWTPQASVVSQPAAPISPVASDGAERAAAPKRSGTESPAPMIGPSSGSMLDITTPAATASDGASAKSLPATLAVIASIWFVGVLLVLLRLAIGTWRVNQLAREGSRVEDGVWLSLAQRLANRLGVTRPLTLLRGERLAVPVTWGIVYPAVLLPQDADEWTEERRRFVLVHEMAHIKRFDALTQLVAQLAAAVFWFDPLVWLAAHQMRKEREHACDDYVLRDGTTPSLYAGELLEMVRSIGTPDHDRAAPAFAALAMARRSEFEGRMLSILDPRLDRKTLNRRSTLMTAVVVALLTIPLAALRPYQQLPTPKEDFPSSFKVSISEDPKASATAAAASIPVAPAASAQSTSKSATATKSAQGGVVRWSCEAYPVGTVLYGTSRHISEHVDDNNNQKFDYLVSEPGRCTEAVLIGKAVFSPDEKRLAQLAPGGFARFRERTRSADRAVSVVPVGDGSLSYTATLDGRAVPFDEGMVSWLSELLPQILREAGMNVPDRVARLRSRGGVPAVLREIAQIGSSSSKRMHYEELIKHGPMLSDADAEKIAGQVGRDLTSSGDLSAVLQMLPRSAVQSRGVRTAVAQALSQISSSGDRANTLQVLAPNADPEMLVMLAKAAETLPSSGDKANFLMTTASEYLTPGTAVLRNAFFKTASTLQSSGDMANVLISAIPYGHASPQVALEVIETSKSLASSGDAANVLLSLISQRVVQPGNSRATVEVIERTLTMASSGDRANVLISLANRNLLTSSEVRDAFLKAAAVLPSDGDRANVLAAAARR
jgi:beta-lactamase regulating signal transducer with metallopeptidase domain